MAKKTVANEVTGIAAAHWISLRTPDGDRIIITPGTARALIERLPVLVAQSDMIAGRLIAPSPADQSHTAFIQ
jgi:hypothetical protein